MLTVKTSLDEDDRVSVCWVGIGIRSGDMEIFCSSMVFFLRRETVKQIFAILNTRRIVLKANIIFGKKVYQTN